MLIANPIYDVVFKYLMEDSKVAKLLIGSIIGAEVLELEFRPKSFTANVSGAEEAIRPLFTIYHLDFSAKIKTKEEEKLVIIEVQKAKLPTDILRFRQYQHILNVHEEDFPEHFRSIIRRLQKAVEVPEIRDNMEAEDTYLDAFEDQER